MVVSAAGLPQSATVAAEGPTIYHAGGRDSRVLDITPDGRYVLIAGQMGTTRVRLDRHRKRRVTVPFGRYLTSNGRAVIGVVDNQLKRYNIPTKQTRNLPMPGDDWIVSDVSSTSNGATRIGVIASSGRRGTIGAFIVNVRTGRVKRIDHRVPWRGGMGYVGGLKLSADGSIATFHMGASTGGYSDVFVYRAKQRTVRAVTRNINGKRTTGYSQVQSISGNGRFILFKSDAPRLVPNTPKRVWRYFLRDRWNNKTRRVFIPVSQRSDVPAEINHDGSRIAFVLDGTVRTPVGPREGPLLGYRDRRTGTTVQLMRGVHGGRPNGALTNGAPLAIDAAGTKVGFTSYATNLTSRDIRSSHRGYLVRP